MSLQIIIFPTHFVNDRFEKKKTKQKGVKVSSHDPPPYRHSRYRLLIQHHIDEVP